MLYSKLFDYQPLKYPSVNIKENEKDYLVEVVAPGLEKDDFKVKIEKDSLIISSEKESKDENFSRKEYSFSSFKRSFILPDDVDKDSISAEYKNGILILTLNKSKEKESKFIQIS